MVKLLQESQERVMKPVDQFKRTPLRRYDLPAPDEGRFEHERRFRKRYFDLPFPETHSMILKNGCLLAAFIVIAVFCTGSAPLQDVPSAQQRFEEWVVLENEKTIKELPGATPEPQSEMAQAVAFDEGKQQEQIHQQIEVQAAATEAPGAETDALKHYESGELAYYTDRMQVTIEQKSKDGMTYFVCDIQLTDVSQLRSAFAGDDFKSGIYEAVSDIAGRYEPVLAINADFCRYHRNGVIIRNGELYRKQNITKHHLLIIDENGDMSALTDRSGKQGLVADRLMRENVWQTLEFGPVLVENGEAATLPKSFYVNCHDGYYEPRTAIGQIGPLHYLIIVVDGRRDNYSTGCSIPTLQKLFPEEGVQFAFNLDGGGSTTLYFLGEVVNMPSGGKERSVSDILMFMANPVH